MFKISALILLSVAVLSHSADLRKHLNYVPNSVHFDLNDVQVENEIPKPQNPDNLHFEHVKYAEDQSENTESNNKLTMFGYHMKIGVPKAIEQMMAENLQTRIIGGSQVSSVIPHQAGIIARLTNNLQSVCGGSLLSNTRVLTAAHCWWDGENRANQFTIVLGSITIFTGGTRIITTAVTMHQSWNARDITNDIAMVRINSVTYSNTIKSIALPTTSEANLNFAGTTGTLSGFGKIRDVQAGSTTNLHQVSVSIITNAVCQNSYKTVTLHSSHLCTSGAGNVGSCDGDSGGPLTTTHNKKLILVGVVSFGLSEGCQGGHPSVYTRVTSFLSWINSNM